MISDKIHLNGMMFHGYHGVGQEERKLGQGFLVDLEVYLDTNVAGISDDIVDTIDYSKVYSVVKGIIEGTSRNLLECLAELITEEIFDRFEPKALLVRIKKPQVPITGSVMDYAGVEIFRKNPKDIL